jgi:archaemetzincin
VDGDVMEAADACVWDRFGFETRRLAPLPDPVNAYDLRRNQYSSVPILRDLVSRRPADAVRLLALTEKDLFIPMLSFIYGQAQLGQSVALVSLARLRQEFYGLPPNQRTLLARTLKESLHEVGHTFNLVHCPDPACVMSVATNIRQLDRKTGAYCRTCGVLLSESLSAVRRRAVASGETR